MKICSECPTPIPKGRSNGAKTCSDSCSKKRKQRWGRDYHSKNKEKRCAYVRQWRRDNPTYDQDRLKADPSRRERDNKTQREWLSRNPDARKRYNARRRANWVLKVKTCLVCQSSFTTSSRDRAQRGVAALTCSKECEAEQKRRVYRRWYNNNRDHVLEYQRMRKITHPPAYPRAHGCRKCLDALLFDFKGICGICGGALPNRRSKIHVHHHWPKGKGGSDDYTNLQPAHAFCNISRSDEWDGTKQDEETIYIAGVPCSRNHPVTPQLDLFR